MPIGTAIIHHERWEWRPAATAHPSSLMSAKKVGVAGTGVSVGITVAVGTVVGVAVATVPPTKPVGVAVATVPAPSP